MPLYAIAYAPDAEEHLKAMTARERRIVLDGVERHLALAPTAISRSRKRMRPNPLAGWELRLGELRVYYDVSEDPLAVYVIAVGRKIRSQVVVGGEVLEL